MLYASAAAVASAVAVAAWQHRIARGAVSLAVLMLGIAIWSGTAATMWNATTLEQQVFWLNAGNLGVWMVSVAVLTIAFEIAEMRQWLVPHRIVPIAAVAFILNNVSWLNPGDSYYAGFVARTVGAYTHYDPELGILHWVYNAYAYTLVITAFVILIRAAIRYSGAERTQAVILVVGGFVPLVGDILTESGVIPLAYLNLTPLSFLITGALWLAAILRGTLLDVLPAARDALIAQMVDGVIVLDRECRVVDANPAALTTLRWSLADALGKDADEILADVEGASRLLGSDVVRRAVLPLGRDGDAHYVEFTVTPLTLGENRRLAHLMTLHDVTEERRAYERLVLARAVFETANEGMLITVFGGDGRIVDVNDAFCRLTLRSRGEILGRDSTLLVSDRHPPEFYDAIRETLLAQGLWEGEVWQTRADGTEFPSWSSISLLRDEAGGEGHVVSIVTDISAVKEVGALRYSATHDPLTGLANRFVLDDALERALAHARRGNRGLAVLLIDLDGFKGVNDTFGRDFGDALLVEVAKRIRAVTREDDTVGRSGGDEFIVVTDTGDSAEVGVEARRLREALAAPYRVDSETAHVTASIGIALSPRDGVDATSVIRNADLAMYGAKRLGRNRIQFFSKELQEDLDKRMAVEEELLGGLAQDRCLLLYQPQVDLSTGLITGAEALVYLRSKGGTLLSLGEFMSAAEYSGLIVQLWGWELRRACEDLAALHETSPDLGFSLSLSARQLREIRATSLRDTLGDYGVKARYISLEIAEAALSASPDITARLEELREIAGIGLSLGDFGRGHPSSSIAHTFRGGTIKIDRSFVGRLPGNTEASAIVLSTIALAKGLGARVVADGPETDAQVRFLRANGCDAAQGFYFGYPVSAEELTLLLRGDPYSVPRV